MHPVRPARGVEVKTLICPQVIATVVARPVAIKRGSLSGSSIRSRDQYLGVYCLPMAGLGTSVTASPSTDAYGETVARRRSAALLSEFGLGHVREYAPLDLILSALHLILRAKSQHIWNKCARMALRATFSWSEHPQGVLHSRIFTVVTGSISL